MQLKLKSVNIKVLSSFGIGKKKKKKEGSASEEV